MQDRFRKDIEELYAKDEVMVATKEWENGSEWVLMFKFTRSHTAANSSAQDSDKRAPNFVSISFDVPTAVSAILIHS